VLVGWGFMQQQWHEWLGASTQDEEHGVVCMEGCCMQRASSSCRREVPELLSGQSSLLWRELLGCLVGVWHCFAAILH
jgi:hypothetical protein